MPKRWCITCRQLFNLDSTGTLRCPSCQATATARRNARAPRAQRGYGPDHQRERKRWEPVVAAGNGWCTQPVCLEPTRYIMPGTPWDLAHNEDRTGWRGPAHARCNRNTGNSGRNAAR